MFDEVTNSYKFLFFLALLENAERTAFEPSVPIPLKEVLLDMLVLSSVPTCALPTVIRKVGSRSSTAGQNSTIASDRRTFNPPTSKKSRILPATQLPLTLQADRAATHEAGVWRPLRSPPFNEHSSSLPLAGRSTRTGAPEHVGGGV